MGLSRDRFLLRRILFAVVVTVAGQHGSRWAVGADPDRRENPLSELRDPDLKVRRAAAVWQITGTD